MFFSSSDKMSAKIFCRVISTSSSFIVDDICVVVDIMSVGIFRSSEEWSEMVSCWSWPKGDGILNDRLTSEVWKMKEIFNIQSSIEIKVRNLLQHTTNLRVLWCILVYLGLFMQSKENGFKVTIHKIWKWSQATLMCLACWMWTAGWTLPSIP